VKNGEVGYAFPRRSMGTRGKACDLSGQQIKDHFVKMHEMLDITSGAQRDMNVSFPRSCVGTHTAQTIKQKPHKRTEIRVGTRAPSSAAAIDCQRG